MIIETTMKRAQWKQEGRHISLIYSLLRTVTKGLVAERAPGRLLSRAEAAVLQGDDGLRNIQGLVAGE